MDKTILANIAATLSALSAGASIVATRFILGETNPVSLAFLRYFIATICLLPILYLGLRKRPIPFGHIFPIIILGSLLFTFFPWGFSASLKYTTAAYGAIALSTMPIFTLIIACIFKKEVLTNAKIIGVGLAFLGVTIAVSRSLLGNTLGENDFLGIFLMLTSSLCAAVYSTFSRPLILTYGPVLFTAMSITVGMLLLSPIAHNVGTFSILPTFSTMGWVSIIFLGAIGGALQFTAYSWALAWLTPTRTAIYLTLTPISAVILAYPLLDEKITFETTIGLILVLIAIFLINRARTKQ
jgi:drug/metabolite transporter (DMT)-like permease